MKNKTNEKDKIILTKESIRKLKEELSNLIHIYQKEIIEELKVASAQGDLSENAEYDAAKQKQVQIDERIQEINGILKNYEIATTSKKGVVLISKTVELLDLKSNQKMVFKIGTVSDINVEKNIISNVSPLAKAIVGHRVNDKILIKLSANHLSYWVKILSIK